MLLFVVLHLSCSLIIAVKHGAGYCSKHFNTSDNMIHTFSYQNTALLCTLILGIKKTNSLPKYNAF